MFYYTLFYYRFGRWQDASFEDNTKKRLQFLRKNAALFPLWAIRRNRDGVIIAQSKNYKGMP